MPLKAGPSRLSTAPRRLASPAKKVDPFYESREWRDFATTIKAQRGWRCEDCGVDCSQDKRALHADHIVERVDGGADFDPLNIRCRCASCHYRKGNRARQARGDRWR